MENEALIYSAIASMGHGADVETTLRVMCAGLSRAVPRCLVQVASSDVHQLMYRDGTELDFPRERLLRLVTTGSIPIDPHRVPLAHRNRWVEPLGWFLDRERYSQSPVGSLMQELGVLYFGRYFVCEEERVVGVVGASLPIGVESFTDAERATVSTTAAAWAPLLRLLARVREASTWESISRDIIAEGAGPAFVVGPNGLIIAKSPRGAELLAQHPRLRTHVEELRPVPPETVVERTYPGAGWRLTSRLAPTASGTHTIVTASVAGGDGPANLTERQRELLDYVELGYTNQQIGVVMGISDTTVKTMLQRLYARTGTASRLELVRWRREPVGA